MHPIVHDGSLVTLSPVEPADLDVGDVVLVEVGGHDFLHLIKAVNGGLFLIGNNRGGINGWVTADSIFGVATRITG
jgi:hypothetical protein